MSAIAISTDKRGIAYVLQELEAGNALGRRLGATLPQFSGTTRAVVPESHRDDIYNFRQSVFSETPRAGTVVSRKDAYVVAVSSTERDVANWVYLALKRNPFACFVCESYLLRPADIERATSIPPRSLAHGGFVYHIALSSDSPDAVLRTVRMAYPKPLGLGVVSLMHEALVLGDTLPGNWLDAIANGVQSVVVGAYDGESVLIWTKHSAAVAVVPASAERIG